MYNNNDSRFRINVLFDTIDHIKDNSELYKMDKVSYVDQNPQKVDLLKDRIGQNKIFIDNKDCLKVAETLKNPMVLNMASYHTPGGGCFKGSGAQEEDLCRRTTLGYSIFKYSEESSQHFGDQYVSGVYPLGGTSKCIWSEHVTVLKDSRENQYKYLKNPFEISVLSIPAYRHTTDGYSESEISDWHEKIRAIFRMSAINSKKNLVLSAFGCGAYKNDPWIIAKIFKDVLGEPEFSGLFDEIHFAILDKNILDGKETNNYNIFSKILYDRI